MNYYDYSAINNLSVKFLLPGAYDINQLNKSIDQYIHMYQIILENNSQFIKVITMIFYHKDGRKRNIRVTKYNKKTNQETINYYENHPQTLTLIIKPNDVIFIDDQNNMNYGMHLQYIYECNTSLNNMVAIHSADNPLSQVCICQDDQQK